MHAELLLALFFLFLFLGIVRSLKSTIYYVCYTPEMVKASSRWEGLLRMYNPEGSTYDLQPPFRTVVLQGVPQRQG